MAISEDTKAIISQLEMQGELIRNTGTNSLREVNVKLDKFSDAFVSIAANISSNNQMLQNSQKMMRERAEYDRQQRDFDDLKRDNEVRVKEKSDLGVKEGLKDIKDSLSGFSMSGLVGGIGKAIGVGMAGFVGANLLKGFVDERYDGAFTDMQTSINDSLEGFDPKALTESVEKLTTQIEQINQQVKDATDSLLWKIAGFALSIPLGWSIAKGLSAGIPKGVKVMMDARRARVGDGLEEARRIKAEQDAQRAKRNKGPVGDFDGPNNLTQPEFDPDNPNRPIGTNSEVDTNKPKKLNAPDGPTPFDIDTRSPRQPLVRTFASFNSDGTLKRNPAAQNFISRAKSSAYTVETGRAAGTGNTDGKKRGTFASKAEIEASLKDAKQLKIFKNLVRGFAVLGLALAIYDMNRIYGIITDDSLDPELKKAAIVEEIGVLLTSGVLAGAGGLVGVFGGPWGILIGSVIGGILGALIGPTIAGMVWDWATEVPLTEEQAMAQIDAQIAKQEEFVNKSRGHSRMGAQMGLDALVNKRNNLVSSFAAERQARAVAIRPAVQEGMNYLQSGMESAAYGSGGRRMFEISRTGTPQQKAVLLDALLEVESRYQKGMTDIASFLTGVSPTIINAPTNVNPVITNTHGGNSKSEVNVVGGGFAGDTFVNGLPYLAQ